MQRIPVSLAAEYRGLRAAESYVDSRTGEKRQVGARLKFEVTSTGDDVELIDLSVDRYEATKPDVPAGVLKRGDQVIIHAVAVIRDGFLQPVAIVLP